MLRDIVLVLFVIGVSSSWPNLRSYENLLFASDLNRNSPKIAQADVNKPWESSFETREESSDSVRLKSSLSREPEKILKTDVIKRRLEDPKTYPKMQFVKWQRDRMPDFPDRWLGYADKVVVELTPWFVEVSVGARNEDELKAAQMVFGEILALTFPNEYSRLSSRVSLDMLPSALNNRGKEYVHRIGDKCLRVKRDKIMNLVFFTLKGCT